MEPEWISLEDYIKRQPWRFRLRMVFARLKVKYILWKGWRPTIQALCRRCLHPIELNHDDEVCLKCGGLNYRTTLRD